MTTYNEKWYYSTPTGNAYGTFYIAVGFRTNADGTETDTTIRVDKCVRLISTGTWSATISWDSPFTGTSLSGNAGVKYDSGWVSQGAVAYNSTVASGSYTAGFTSYSGTTYETTFSGVSYTPYKPPQTPDAPTIGTNTRNSDTQNTITWTNPSTAGSSHAKGYSNILILRSTDGGELVQIASLSYNDQTSFTDTSTSANHYYQYKVAGYNSAGSSLSAYSTTTYNTPSAPTSLSGVYATGSGSVSLTWDDNAISETGYTLQSANDSAFTSPSSYTLSANTTSYTDSQPPAGTAYYRIKATNTSLESDWSNVAQITTLCAPAKPDLLLPNSSAVLDVPTTIKFTWKHNALDGTSQTAAQLAYSTTSASSGFTTVTVGTNQYYELTSSFTRGQQVWWKVRTKGNYTDYSEYSDVRSFKVEQSPSVAITLPVAIDGGTIDTVPVQVAFTYSDQSGSLSNWSFNIVQNGSIIYSKTGLTGTSYTIPVSDLLPANETSYTLNLTANSTSGLSTSTARIFATDYEEPNPPVLNYSIDSDSCSVQLQATSGTGTSEIPTVAVGIFRADRDGETAILTSGASGTSVVDYLPPLDRQFQYRAVAYASSGLSASTLVNVTVDSDGKAFFNWGDNYSTYASFNMNLTWNSKTTHDRALYQVVGRTDPVLRYSGRRNRSLTCAGTVWWEDDAQLEALEQIPNTVFFREPRGHCIPVAVTVGNSYPADQPTMNTSIEMTQVDYVG